MLRFGIVLAAAVAMAFAVDSYAQDSGGERDGARQSDGERPRGGERPRDGRGPRDGDRPRDGRGGPRDGRGGQFGFRAHPLMTALDTNNDGELSAEEIEQASKTLLTLDKNGDKKLSSEEIRPAFGPGMGGPGGPGRQFEPGAFIDRLLENDANDDGKLSKDELPERMQQRFDNLDANSDGFVDRSELETFSRQMRERMGDRPGQRGPRDGDRPRDGRGGPRDGDRPQRGPRDGDRPSADRPEADRAVTDDDL